MSDAKVSPCKGAVETLPMLGWVYTETLKPWQSILE